MSSKDQNRPKGSTSKGEKREKVSKELSDRARKDEEMRAKFAFFATGYNGEGVDKLVFALATKHNEYRPTRILPVSEERNQQYFRIFGRFIIAGFVPPHSFFLSAIMETYGLIMAQLHPTSFFTLAVFQHLCEAFVGVMPSVVLFRHYYYPRVEKKAPLSLGVVF